MISLRTRLFLILVTATGLIWLFAIGWIYENSLHDRSRALSAYDGVPDSVITTKASVQALKTQGWTQPQSNYSGQIDWTLTYIARDLRGGRFWDNFRTWAFRISPISGRVRVFQWRSGRWSRRSARARARSRP